MLGRRTFFEACWGDFYLSGVFDPGWSNGRTADFGSANLGSNPSPGAINRSKARFVAVKSMEWHFTAVRVSCR
jgi:hypothetical protein